MKPGLILKRKRPTNARRQGLVLLRQVGFPGLPFLFPAREPLCTGAGHALEFGNDPNPAVACSCCSTGHCHVPQT